MPDLTQSFILALIQGLTEFLPISSSAHLILAPKLLGWPDQGLSFDVAVHLGTLCAVICYFARDLRFMCKDFLLSITQRRDTPYSKLSWGVILGTIPVGMFGLLFHDQVEYYTRSTSVIAYTTIGFAVLLAFASYYAKEKRSELEINWKDVLVVGLLQAISLIPGTSRSGITMTGGLFRGLSKEAAARFAFLLSIPVIILASGLEYVKLLTSDAPIDYSAIILGFFTAGISGYFCIKLFINLINKFGFMPFIVYRIILGFILLYAL